ncbi:hypothetical protein BZL29_3978 [Mycobacterium kansasii]|uniref:Uncharacterized protein n=1 Tax=Mycobacterium kansasii TaxID=1768 RepID=A0A1V3XDA8_MYCKA|nr:hypothetical protein BZL29_3978 [Mycobacterium kansasii]
MNLLIDDLHDDLIIRDDLEDPGKGTVRREKDLQVAVELSYVYVGQHGSRHIFTPVPGPMH